MIPPLSDLLDSARVVALPMHSRFRGVDVREALLFEGPEGWAEFSPFVEYEDAEAATWLAAAIDFAWREQPEPLRDRIGVNATVPAIEASPRARAAGAIPGCRTAKVKVAEPGQTLSDDVARVRAVRETGMAPEWPHQGRCERSLERRRGRCTPCMRWASTTWSTWSSPARRCRSWRSSAGAA